MEGKKLWVKAVGLGLCAALLLSGCGGGGGSSVSQSGDQSDASSASSSADQSSGPKDYSKYNAYMDLYGELQNIEEVLVVYFANVDYTEKFAVVEGGDYAALKDAVQYYTGHGYMAREALEYVDEEPSYPRVDAAVRALGDSPEKMMDALDSLNSYMVFGGYEDDGLAKAKEIHAAIWDAIQVFGPNYGEMMDAMDELAEATRDEDMENMLNEGQMILYHSRVMIHTSEDILNGIWDQLEASLEAADPEAEFVLPAIDMTDLSPLFGEFNSAYEELTKALEDEDEQAKAFTGPVSGTVQLYKMRVDSLYTQMGQLAQALMDGADYGDIYDATSSALSGMIDAYNMII